MSAYTVKRLGGKETHLTIQLNHIGGQDVSYDHNFMLGSAIYKLLEEHSENASKAVHDSHYRSPYVLSEIYRVRKKPNEAWFRIGLTNNTLIKLLAKSLSPGSELTIGNTKFQITGIQMEEPIVRPGEYITLSPILLRDRENGQSLVHDTPGYVKSLEAAMRPWNKTTRNYWN